MDFGYFMLSDNNYENTTRTANQFVAEIADQALYAEELGMHSAWIGEHHFNSLLGSPRRITDTLKKAEAACISEDILYVNVGLKARAQVRDEMARFMAEVAPSFEGAHARPAA